MANVMSLKDLRNNVSRNGFDLSQNVKFTANPGELLPVFCKILMPGDSLRLKASVFTRTIPLNTAAYVRLREEINFFVVPIHQLWSSADTFFAQMVNNPQHALSPTTTRPVSSNTPYLTLESIAQKIFVNSLNYDVLGKNCAKQSCKLLEYLGYGDFSRFIGDYESSYGTVKSAAGDYKNISFSPFPLLAYQKIYSDFYRFQQWENANPTFFNIDYATNQSLWSSLLPDSYKPTSQIQIDMGMCAMRYANYPKDMLFGILPSPQYGDSSTVPIVDTKGVAGFLNGSDTRFFTTPNNVEFYNPNLPHDVRVQISNPSVLAIRKAEALQKLREIQLSGDQDYKTQIEKIFNVTMSDDMSDLSTWIGGFDNDIAVNEVVNNNLTGDANADIQGKGLGSKSSDFIDYESKDWCIVMGIYTCRPILDFSLDYVSPEVFSTHIDHFPNPVLDKVGNESTSFLSYVGPFTKQAPSGYTWDNAKSSDVLFDVCSVDDLPRTVGYGPRYYKWKTNYDRVLGGFRNTLASWVAPYDYKRLSKSFVKSTGIFVNYGTFKVDDSILDTVFISSDTDKLLVNMDIVCPIVRNLDYDGLPY